MMRQMCRAGGHRYGSDIEFVKITPEIDVAALSPFIAAGARSARATSQRRTTPTMRYQIIWAEIADLMGALRIVHAC
jgi:hypothetical protein